MVDEAVEVVGAAGMGTAAGAVPVIVAKGGNGGRVVDADGADTAAADGPALFALELPLLPDAAAKVLATAELGPAPSRSAIGRPLSVAVLCGAPIPDPDALEPIDGNPTTAARGVTSGAIIALSMAVLLPAAFLGVCSPRPCV